MIYNNSPKAKTQHAMVVDKKGNRESANILAPNPNVGSGILVVMLQLSSSYIVPD